MKKYESAIGNILIATAIAVLLSITGCAATMTGINGQIQNSSIAPAPGHNLWKCFVIAGGPPVGGKLVAIELPDTQIGPTFGDGCSIIPAPQTAK